MESNSNNLISVVDRLREYGYQLYLDGDNIRYKYVKAGKPSGGALPLLDAIRKHKHDVVELLKNHSAKELKPVTSDQLDSPDFTQTFDTAVDRINQQYQSGTLDYCKQHHADTYNRMIEVESRINRLWDTGTDLEAFKEATKEWGEVLVELVKLFNDG